MSMADRVCGAVVIYRPEPDVLRNVAAMRAECGTVFAADNGCSPSMRARLIALGGIEWIDMEGNRGVGAALNVAAARARALGYDWLVTFDQDSTPREGFVRALLDTARRHPLARLVVPRIVEAGRGSGAYRWVRRHPRWPFLYQRVPVGGSDLAAITLAVTSGTLTHLETWEKLGGFDEALFIDYVDIDYCLKVRRAGGDIVVSAAAELEHQLGARQSRRLLGHEFRPTFHAAFRHYYMARNRVRIWSRHAVHAPHWALFDASYAAYNLLRVVAFEPQKWACVKALALGTWDGLRGCTGPCPESRQRALSPRSV